MKNPTPAPISRCARQLVLATVLGLNALACATAAAQAAPTTVASLREGNPYRYVGLLNFASDGLSYAGSATVVKPSSLLTAGHNLYSEGIGWSTDVVFMRSYDYGSFASQNTASTLFLLGGYAASADRGKSESAAGFSRDLGGVVCFSRPADGLFAAWRQDTKLLTGKSYNMSLGYGGEVNSGEELLRSSPTRAFRRILGSYYENRSCGIEGGMSGGPVFAKSRGKWYLCAVNVSGPGRGIFKRDLGVRAIDADAAALIRLDLK